MDNDPLDASVNHKDPVENTICRLGFVGGRPPLIWGRLLRGEIAHLICEL